MTYIEAITDAQLCLAKLKAIDSLLASASDLHIVSADDLSVLLGGITDQLQVALEGLPVTIEQPLARAAH